MNKQEYELFKKQLAQSQQKSQKMLARIQNTLDGVKETINQIHQNQQNIEKFKRDFGEVMNKLAFQIAGGLGLDEPFKKVEGKQYENLPTKISIAEATKRMLKYNQILIITGAGVSAKSGIPTFRGQNGLYSKKFEFEGKEYQPEVFITKAFYQQHPKPIWEWLDDIQSLSQKCKPNENHILIDQLAKKLNAKGKKVVLVTQNIDNLHLKPKNHEYEYYDVHGNVQYVRCQKLHLTPYQEFKQLRIKGEAKCKECGMELRPHVLFFDQSYGPLYGQHVKERTFPFVIVIGSSLKTGLCIRLTRQASEVIQINPEPVIEIGKVYPFKETQRTLKSLIEESNKIK